MMTIMKSKITSKNIISLAAVFAALVGMIIYIITSVTGYLAVSAMNPWPVICTIVCMALLCGTVFMQEKVTPLSADLMTAAGFVMLLVSFYFFVMSRVSLAADVYFIPVNYPEAEVTALHTSIVGVVFYLAALTLLIVEGFRRKA